jgi:hypothetical protein
MYNTVDFFQVFIVTLYLHSFDGADTHVTTPIFCGVVIEEGPSLKADCVVVVDYLECVYCLYQQIRICFKFNVQ